MTAESLADPHGTALQPLSGAPEDGALAAAPEPEELLALLEALARALEHALPHDRAKEAIGAACRAVAPTARAAGFLRLRAAAAGVGLDLELARMPLARAIETADPRRPLVALAAAGEPGSRFLLLRGRRGARAEVASARALAAGESPELLRPAELALRLGVEPEEEAPFALVTHLASADGLRAVEGAIEAPPRESLAAPASAGGYAGAYPKKSPLRRLIGLFRPERGDLAVIAVFSLALGLLELATPVAVEALFTSVSFGGLLQPIVVLAAVLLVFLTIRATIEMLKLIVVEMLERRLFVRVVADLSYRLPHARLDPLAEKRGPSFVNRFFELATLQKTSAKLLLDGITVATASLVGLAVLAVYHPALFAFDIVLVVGIVGVVGLLGRGAQETALRESDAKHEIGSHLQELARAARAFKAAGAWEAARDHADTLAATWLDRRAAHFGVVARQVAGALALQVLATTLLLGLGGWLVATGELTLGQLVAAWLIVSLVVASIAKLSRLLASAYDLLAAADKLGKLADVELDRADGEPLPESSRPLRIELRGLVPVEGASMGAVTLDVAPGEKVALLGASGSGKTLLLEVLGGVREPARGLFRVDGHDFRAVSLESYRELVALARPDGVVAGSVLENLRMGRHGLGLERVRWALAAVGLLEAVERLPRGLETELRAGGAPLSGGQAARLTLARALAGRPRLLAADGVLDLVEPEERTAIVRRLLLLPCTLVIATHDTGLAGLIPRRVELVPDALGGADATEGAYR